MDTGSTVCPVTESSCNKYLTGSDKIHAQDEILKIEEAGGHKLPYSGFVEMELRVRDMMESVVSILLVVADTLYGYIGPVILHFNILTSLTQA